MIPAEAVRGSQRLSTISVAYPAKTLQTAVIAAVVLFLVGSLTHGYALFGLGALGSLTYHYRPPVFSDLRGATLVQAPTSSPVAAAVMASSPAAVAPISVAAFAADGSVTTPPPTITLVASTTIAMTTTTTATANSTSSRTGAAGSTDKTANADPVPIAGGTLQDLTRLPKDAFAQIGFGLNEVRSSYNCTDTTPQQLEFCKFLEATVSGSPYYSELANKTVWSKIDLPRTVWLQVIYYTAHVLLIGAVTILCAPVMSLNGQTKRLIGSSLIDGAAALAGAAVAWQRWFSIRVPDLVQNVFDEQWPGVFVGPVVKSRSPSLAIVIVSGVLWAAAASIMALEWILHSRTQRENVFPAAGGAALQPAESEQALNDEEVSLLLNPPA